MPRTMDTGISARAPRSAPPPWAIPRKVENSTMTNTSSQKAPAMIIWGIPLPVPRRASISSTIRGTTTAGDTAPSTAPMTAASTRSTPRMDGAKSMKARISQEAGTQDIMAAGRPTARSSERSRDRPAFRRMMMRAICRRSADTASRLGARASRAKGPRAMPASSIPMIRGRPARRQTAAAARPSKKMSARDVTISNFLPYDAKSRCLLRRKSSQKSTAFKSGSGGHRPAAGELHSRVLL